MTYKKKTILIIDDDSKLCSLLGRFLEERGYRIVTANEGESGIKKIDFVKADLIILDIMLPGEDGFEILKKIRAFSNIPIIMLTARGDVSDKVAGLRIGADDYVQKPFEPAEIEARIETVLRRKSNPPIIDEIISFSSFSLNTSKRNITVNGKENDLTNSEYRLLLYLIENKNQVASREQILEKLRGDDFESFNRSVDILVSRLRKKLNDDGKNLIIIKTVHGHGYMFIAS